MPGVSFAGIYDKNPARAAEVAKQLETVAHPALGALLECVDAVTVAVPTPAHAEVGNAVLERGIALLMEKPLADTIAGAEELVRGAAARGARSEEHTSELQSPCNLVCRLLLEKKKTREKSVTYSC